MQHAVPATQPTTEATGQVEGISAASLTPQERHLRAALRIFAALFALGILAYLLPALIGPARAYWIQLPFVGNSVVKVGLLGMLCAVAAADVRRFSMLVPIVIIGHAISLVASIIMLIWADTAATFPIAGMQITAAALLWGAIGLDGAILLLFAWLYDRAQRARHGLRYLSPYEFQTVVALAEVLVPGAERQITTEAIGANVDAYLATFSARRKWVINLALLGLHLYPLLSLHPTLPAMALDERRRFVKDRFEGDVAGRLIPGFWRTLVQAMIRVAQQLATSATTATSAPLTWSATCPSPSARASTVPCGRPRATGRAWRP